MFFFISQELEVKKCQTTIGSTESTNLIFWSMKYNPISDEIVPLMKYSSGGQSYSSFVFTLHTSLLV